METETVKVPRRSPKRSGVTPISTGWGNGADFGLDLPDLFQGVLSSQGELEGWLELSPIIAAYPRLRAPIYAALLPPLMRVLGGVENISFQIVGPSASGKTTAIALAASLWGNPSLAADTPVILPWGASQEFLVEAAATFRDLPLFLEDFEGSSARHRVDKMAALLAGRGGGDLVRNKFTPLRSWSTVVLSSAVRGVEDLDETGCLSARSISLWGSPFGKIDEDSAQAIGEIQRVVSHHHGVLGPEWIGRIQAAESAWPKWKANHESRVTRFSSKAAEQGGFASRAAKAISALATTAVIFHTLFPELEWDHDKTIEDLWVWLNLNGHKTNKGYAGLEAFRAWWETRRLWFFGRGGQKPPGGWKGVIRKNKHGDAIVWVFEEEVRAVLLDAGFNPTDVYEDWVRGEICVPTWGRVWRTVKLLYSTKRCIGFPMEALNGKPEQDG